MPNVYEQVKQAIQDVVAPNLAKIEGKIEALTVEIRRLDEKIDSLRNETNIRFNSLEDKLETGLEFRDRFAALESKVAALSK